MANLGGVDDPRQSEAVDHIGESHDADFPPVEKLRHDAVLEQNARRHGSVDVYTDSNISFEEYHWWANKSREYERGLKADKGFSGLLQVITGKKEKAEGLPGVIPENDGRVAVPASTPNGVPTSEKAVDEGPDSAASDHSSDDKAKLGDVSRTTWNGQPSVNRYGITDDEWYNAQRSVRTATWGSIFYLITTDILGMLPSIAWKHCSIPSDQHGRPLQRSMGHCPDGLWPGFRPLYRLRLPRRLLWLAVMEAVPRSGLDEVSLA